MEPETLRTYAKIFDLPRRQERGGPMLPPTELCAAAAVALRFMADALAGHPAPPAGRPDSPSGQRVEAPHEMQVHRVMTSEEYNRFFIKGWHGVHYNYDGAGNVAVSFLSI